MKVWVLSGQVEYEDYAVYGVFGSLEAARTAGDKKLAELGGPDSKWLKPNELEEWKLERGALSISVKRSGYDLSIIEHELVCAPNCVVS